MLQNIPPNSSSQEGFKIGLFTLVGFVGAVGISGGGEGDGDGDGDCAMREGTNGGDGDGDGDGDTM
ncbi:MAG: hypothetical protein ACK5LW_10815 [Pseudanabaena sp.]